MVAVHVDVARKKKRNWLEMAEPQPGEVYVALFYCLEINYKLLSIYPFVGFIFCFREGWNHWCR